MRTKVLMIGAGLAAMALFVGVLLFLNRGSRMVLRGEVQNIRVQPMADDSSVVILDFRFVNPADYPFVVRKVDVLLDDKDGKTHEGMVSSDVDAKAIFDYYPMIGPKYNDSFKIREKVPPKESRDRMVAARFELKESEVAQRKALRIRVEEVDGAVSEIVEERK